MTKIGTAHIELKPVLNEEALAQIAQTIEDAVAAGVARGLTAGSQDAVHVGTVHCPIVPDVSRFRAALEEQHPRSPRPPVT